MGRKILFLFILLALATFTGFYLLAPKQPAYPLNPDPISIQSTDFTIQILSEFTFYQSDDVENAWGDIKHFAPNLPHYYVFPQHFSETPFYSKPESLVAATFTDEYTRPKKQHVGDITIYLAQLKENASTRDYDRVVLAVAYFENQGILFEGWGPPERVDEASLMLETMLLTLKVEEPE